MSDEAEKWLEQTRDFYIKVARVLAEESPKDEVAVDSFIVLIGAILSKRKDNGDTDENIRSIGEMVKETIDKHIKFITEHKHS